MIAKKNPRYDLEGKRIVIFSLGLLTTTAATLAAFTYHSPYEFELEKQKIASTVINYAIEDDEIKKETVIDKPIEQPMQTDQQQSDPSQSAMTSATPELSEQIVITTSVPELPDFGVLGLPDLPFGNGTGAVEIVPDPIEFPTKEAEYIGGYAKMQEFILENVAFPEAELEFGRGGVVYVYFVVEPDGSVTNVTIEKGVSLELDREAKRVVRSFPKWIPGEKDAEKVRTVVRLPIRFEAR